MKFYQVSSVPLLLGSLINAFTYERLDKNKSLLLILDMQEGLFSLARDSDQNVFRNGMYAHAALGKAFDLPVVMTSSSQTGPNGPLPDEFLQWYPNAPLIMREGEVDAWDNPQFREAVIAANKSQIIIGGITTDVCTTFLALSLRDAGYSVWANHEASGTTSAQIRDNANDRMRAAGVQIVSYFAIMSELMRDWRNTPGAEQLFPVLDQYYPAYGMVARAHRAAVQNGTVLPGENILP
ncbi:Isochorismatase hydrolase [Jackrogersella minutella]|nr:Isochorismatase hydrolase [Jackrogersella minutella]